MLIKMIHTVLYYWPPNIFDYFKTVATVCNINWAVLIASFLLQDGSIPLQYWKTVLNRKWNVKISYWVRITWLRLMWCLQQLMCYTKISLYQLEYANIKEIKWLPAFLYLASFARLSHDLYVSRHRSSDNISPAVHSEGCRVNTRTATANLQIRWNVLETTFIDQSNYIYTVVRGLSQTWFFSYT